MDEISPSGRTWVWEVRGGEVSAGVLDPAVLRGGGRPVERCAVLLNAAAALYVSSDGASWAAVAERARTSLDGGAAASILARLRRDAPRVSTSG